MERDLKQISNISNLSLFRKFLALLSGRIGQLLNTSSLANDVGVSSVTIENWLSILEASFLIFRLQPYYKNFGKRYIKTSKVYFTDTGIACRLLGISKFKDLEKHYLLGGLFENMIVMEIKKYLINRNYQAPLYFFRDSNGNEIDLIIDMGQEQIPVEIKAGGTFSSDFIKGINYWQALTNFNEKGYVVYSGEQIFEGENYKLLKWDNLDGLLGQI